MCSSCSSTIKHVPYDQYIKEVNHYLTNGGIFLNTMGEKANTMVIGWGGINFFWGKPIFLVPVRASRYTYPNIDASGIFTISVPMDRDMKKALVFCGTKSGREFDKFKEGGLTQVPGKFINVPIIGECSLHYECRVIYKQPMDPISLNQKIDDRFYPDYHTMFYGEILASYTTN